MHVTHMENPQFCPCVLFTSLTEPRTETNFTYVRTNAEGAAIKDCCGLDHLKRSMVLAIYQTSLWITERQETITV